MGFSAQSFFFFPSIVLVGYPGSRSELQWDEKNEEPRVYEVEGILAGALQGGGRFWLYPSVWLDFTG